MNRTADTSANPDVTPEERLARAQKLHDMCGVSFEDARAALEACGYDVLDAAVWLERAGKSAAHAASYSTGEAAGAQEAQAMSDAQIAYERDTRKMRFEEGWARFANWAKRVLRKGMDVSFVVERGGRQLACVPVLLLVVLMLLAFWIIVPLAVVGLFFGFRYRFDGMGAVTVDVNEWTQKASEGAERLKRDFQNSTGGNGEQKRD